MIIKRTVEYEVEPTLKSCNPEGIKGGAQWKVGDVIGFTLNDGEEVEAMAMKIEPDGTIFALVDCIEEERPMMENGELVMRDYLDKELYNRFPKEITNMMLPFENGNMLRLMTQKEVCGENMYDAEEEDASIEQFEPMKLRRNRIADIGKDSGEGAWYWLANQTWLRDVATATYFALVTGDGDAGARNVSNSFGVRPAFRIQNL